MKMHAACLAVASLIAVGCNHALVGQWNLVGTTPPEAAANYEVTSITFNADAKTYSASMRREGKPMISAGEYQFNGFQLTFVPKEGPQRTYSASVNSFTNQLQTRHTMSAESASPSTTVTAVFDKVPMTTTN